jgi:hypothetical protein
MLDQVLISTGNHYNFFAVRESVSEPRARALSGSWTGERLPVPFA